MIEQVLYINLDSRPDRNEKFCEVMESINGGSIPIMQRFRAHYGRDYESSESLIKAGAADGFRFFDQPWFVGGRGNLAYAWSYLSCLRMCVDSGKVTLILFDDRPLGQPISQANEVLQKIEFHEKHPFRILQLNWGTSDRSQSVSRREPLSYLEDYCLGFSGHGDQRNIYSPEGAQWMIDAMSLLPVGAEEFTGFYYHCPYYLFGIYSYRYRKPNPWVASIGIKDDVQDRIEIENEDLSPK